MAIQTYTTLIAHDSDAAFRAWGLELSAELTAVGLPKSADTGQINWATVSRPGSAYSFAGYEIRYLNDSLHATKPCYIKFEFGNNYTTAVPAVKITCGSGTNGAGTITGVMFTALVVSTDNLLTDVVTARATYICTKDGYFGISFKQKAMLSNTGMFFFAVERSIDASGTPNDAAFYFYYSTASGNIVYRKTYIGSEVSDVQSVVLIPGGATSSAVGADVQAFVHYGFQPTVRQVPDLLSYFPSEIGAETTFTATPIGVTARTYLALGAPYTINSASIAMRYEA